MAAEARNGDEKEETVTVIREEEGYVALDEGSGIASEGETKESALINLAEALSLSKRPVPQGEGASEPSSAPWF